MSLYDGGESEPHPGTAVAAVITGAVPTENEQLQNAMIYLIDRYTATGVVIAFGEACQIKADKVIGDWQNSADELAWRTLSEQTFCLACDGL